MPDINQNWEEFEKLKTTFVNCVDELSDSLKNLEESSLHEQEIISEDKKSDWIMCLDFIDRLEKIINYFYQKKQHLFCFRLLSYAYSKIEMRTNLSIRIVYEILRMAYTLQRKCKVKPFWALETIEKEKDLFFILLNESFHLKDSYSIEFLIHLILLKPDGIKILAESFFLDNDIFKIISDQLDEYSIELVERIILNMFIMEKNIVVLETLNRLIYILLKLESKQNIKQEIAENFKQYIFFLETVESNSESVELISSSYFMLGEYTILWNLPGAIEAFDKNLSIKRSLFSQDSPEYRRALRMTAYQIKDENQQLAKFKELYELMRSSTVDVKEKIQTSTHFANMLKKTDIISAISILEDTLNNADNIEFYYAYSTLAYLYKEIDSPKAFYLWKKLWETSSHGGNERFIETTIEYAAQLFMSGNYPQALYIIRILEDIWQECDESIKNKHYHIWLADSGKYMEFIQNTSIEKGEAEEAERIRLAQFSIDNWYYWQAKFSQLQRKKYKEHKNILPELIKICRVISQNTKLNHGANYRDIMIYLAREYAEQDDFQKTVKILQSLIKNPNIPRTLDLECDLIEAMQKRGDLVKNYLPVAIELDERIGNMNPYDFTLDRRIKRILLRAYNEQKDIPESIRIVRVLSRRARKHFSQIKYLDEDVEKLLSYINDYSEIFNTFLFLGSFYLKELSEKEKDFLIMELYDEVNFKKYLLLRYEAFKTERLQKHSQEMDKLNKEQIALLIDGNLKDIENKEMERDASKHNSFSIDTTFRSKTLEEIRNILTIEDILIEFSAIRCEGFGLEIKDFSVLDDDSFNKEESVEAKKIGVMEKYLMFIITKDTPIQYVEFKKHEIDELVSQIHSSLVNNPYQADKAIVLSQELYQILFSGFMKIDSYHNMIVAPDGTLFKIPFEILHNLNRMALGERMNVSYINSGSRLNYDRVAKITFANRAHRNWMFIGNPTVSPLSEADNELNYISKLTNGICFTKEKATKNNFIKHLPKSLIHIATHGIAISDDMSKEFAFNKKVLKECKLILSSDCNLAASEFISAAEISNLNLSQTDLVVVSACSTGTGQFYMDEGVWGIRTAFELAGAKATIVTLWDIDDMAAKLFMTQFYHFLMQGERIEDALRLTRCYLKNLTKVDIGDNVLRNWVKVNDQDRDTQTIDVKSDNHIKLFDSPFYWGSFVLFEKGEN